MKTSALLFATVLLSAVSCASAYDTDPGYGSDVPWLSGERREGSRWYGGQQDGRNNKDHMSEAKYYRPTQRYYGNGYTVSYRFIPVYAFDMPHSGSIGESTNFRTEGFRLTPGQIQAFGANQPRITLKDERSAAPRTAVTSIERKKPTKRAATKGTSQDAPAIMPSTKPATDGAAPTSGPASAPGAAVPGLSAPAPSAPPKP